MEVLTTASTYRDRQKVSFPGRIDVTYDAAHVLDSDKQDDDGEDFPRHHRDPKPDEGANANTRDRADNDFDNTGECETEARVHHVQPSEQAKTVDSERSVRQIGEEGEDREPAAKRHILLVLPG